MLDVLLAPIRHLKPREWLIVLTGILIGLMVSFMFKSMMLGQKPPRSERINGPLNTVESPACSLSLSEKPTTTPFWTSRRPPSAFRVEKPGSKWISLSIREPTEKPWKSVPTNPPIS